MNEDRPSFTSEILFRRDGLGNYVGHCPWHADNEKMSLALSPSRGVVHCFGCGIGGKVSLPPFIVGESIIVTLALSGHDGKWRIDCRDVRYEQSAAEQLRQGIQQHIET